MAAFILAFALCMRWDRVWLRKPDRESGLFPRLAARCRFALIWSVTRLLSWRCPAQTIIPIIAPSGPQAAVIIDHAHMSALAPCAQLLCGIDCEDDRLLADHAGTVLAILWFNHLHIVVPYNIVTSIRHNSFP
jgi:hypothetical protein